MRQQGFTLLELMIVVAILGILISIAVPTYRQHIVRARVMEGLQLAAQAKLVVTETALSNQALPENQQATGYLSPKPTANVKSLTIGEHGIITVIYTKAAGDGTIVLVPTINDAGEITWTCTQGSLAANYRPAECKG